MYTLHPVLSESIMKKMSGGEEKQEERRRSVEGQWKDASRKTNLINISLSNRRR